MRSNADDNTDEMCAPKRHILYIFPLKSWEGVLWWGSTCTYSMKLNPLMGFASVSIFFLTRWSLKLQQEDSGGFIGIVIISTWLSTVERVFYLIIFFSTESPVWSHEKMKSLMSDDSISTKAREKKEGEEGTITSAQKKVN